MCDALTNQMAAVDDIGRSLGKLSASHIGYITGEHRMAKQKVEWGSGNYYHIYNRGAHRLPIVREAANYQFIIKLMKQYVSELGVTVIAYCLMPNHYHWLVRQDGELRAGLLAQRVFNSYSKAFNKRYGHSGTLFEGPYQPILVDKDSYLRHLCIYIHSQPVNDGITPFLDQWPWSNYHEWMGKREGALLDHDFIADHFPDRQRYHHRILDYLESRNLPPGLDAYLRGLEDD